MVARDVSPRREAISTIFGFILKIVTNLSADILVNKLNAN
jgi:hypothetical protein